MFIKTLTPGKNLVSREIKEICLIFHDLSLAGTITIIGVCKFILRLTQVLKTDICSQFEVFQKSGFKRTISVELVRNNFIFI